VQLQRSKQKWKQAPFTDVEELQRAGKAVVCAGEWQQGDFLLGKWHAARHRLERVTDFSIHW